MKNNSPSLHELQTKLKTKITTSEDHSSLSFIIDGVLSAKERIEIYSDAYISRITEALRIDFEATHQTLGEMDFLKLVQDYLYEHPSTSTSIEEVGLRFSEFIETFNTRDEVPFLAELTKLEWIMIESFYADDLLPFDINSLNTIDPSQWEKVKLNFDNSLKLLKTNWPVHKAWEARKRDITPEIKPFPNYYLVYREDYQVKLKGINETEFNLLLMAKNGHSIGLLCQEMEKNVTNEEFLSIFKSWMELGLVKSLSM